MVGGTIHQNTPNSHCTSLTMNVKIRYITANYAPYRRKLYQIYPTPAPFPRFSVTVLSYSSNGLFAWFAFFIIPELRQFFLFNGVYCNQFCHPMKVFGSLQTFLLQILQSHTDRQGLRVCLWVICKHAWWFAGYFVHSSLWSSAPICRICCC